MATLVLSLLGLMAGSIVAEATSFGLFGTSPLQWPQATKVAQDGEQFTVDVGIKLEGSWDTVREFSITASWNEGAFCVSGGDSLIYVDAEEFPEIEGGLLISDGQVDVDGNSVTFEGWAPEGGFGIYGPGEFVVGTITFRAVSPISDDADVCLEMGPTGEWLDKDGLALNPPPQFGTLAVNGEGATATEKKTWGQLKSLYR